MGRDFIPRRDVDAVNWASQFASHIEADAGAFGVSVEQAEELVGYQTAMAAAFAVTIDPSTRSKPALTRFRDARDVFIAYARKLARIIQACPEVTDGMRVRLGLTVPKQREPLAPPGQVHDIKAVLNNNGSLTLSWKCKNPRGAQGTMYQIHRSLNRGPGSYVASAGTKKFTDMTLPMGVSQITYDIHAVRGKTRGRSNTFTVFFGMVGNPATAENGPTKIAA